MRQVEWHEYKEGQIAVVMRYGDVIAGVDFNRNTGDGITLSPVHTVTSVVRVDQAPNENNVLSVTVGDNEFVFDTSTDHSHYEYFACEQSEVGQDVLILYARMMGQVEKPQPNDEPFISTTTTTMENVKNGGTSAIGEVSCSPGVNFAIGNELNDRIIQRIELSEDRTTIELFDPDGDVIVTVRPLEYTAFYLKPNPETSGT